MRTAHLVAIAIAVAGSAALSLPASAERFCREDCVGPLCNRNCVHRDRDVTIVTAMSSSRSAAACANPASRSEGLVPVSDSTSIDLKAPAQNGRDFF